MLGGPGITIISEDEDEPGNRWSEQLARDLAGQVKLVKVNVDVSPQLSQRFGAQAIPTLLVLRGGRVVARQTGAAPLAALRAWVGTALATAVP